MDTLDLPRRAGLQLITSLGFLLNPEKVLSIHAQLHSKNWQLNYFSKPQFLFVSHLCDALLPNTQSIGAKDVGLDRFVDFFIFNCLPIEEQEKLEQSFVIWMADDLARKKDFTRLVKKLDQEQSAEYRILKKIILLGFFTSEPVVTTLFNHHSVPVKFTGDVSIKLDQRLFSDNRVNGNSS